MPEWGSEGGAGGVQELVLALACLGSTAILGRGRGDSEEVGGEVGTEPHRGRKGEARGTSALAEVGAGTGLAGVLPGYAVQIPHSCRVGGVQSLGA